MFQQYPDLAQDMPRNQNGGSTDGTLRCKTDLGLILDGFIDDENGVETLEQFLQVNSTSVTVENCFILDCKFGNLYMLMSV